LLAGELPVAKRIFIALVVIFTGASVLLFNSFYKEAKNIAITNLNEGQMIHAKQAARGIEDFFATWTRSLNSLSRMDAIIDNNTVGKRCMELFYETNYEQVRSITRLDERGVIIYNFPSINSVGKDISDQKHVSELLRDHKPVISDVFRAVEGFDAVALHVPIFRDSVFKGSIGILIDFKNLTNRYLDVIKIGKTGYAWVVSRDGTQLYSTIPGFTGKSVFENIKDFPSLNGMVTDMLKGHEGTATYDFDRIGDRNVGQTRKYAVYMPIQIGNTFWSIAVASAEQDVLSGLISFRNKLAFAIGAIFICGMVFSTLGVKAWFIVKEEEKRRQIEKQLRESEELLRDILFSMADWVWEVDEKGVYTYSSSKGIELFGHVIGKTPFDFMPSDEANRAAAIFSKIAVNKAPIKDMENWNIRKDGERVCLLTNGVPILDQVGNLKGYRGVDKDITNRKQTERELIESRALQKAIVDSTEDMIWTVDSEHFGLLTFNDALREYFFKSRGIHIKIGDRPEYLLPTEEFANRWREMYQRLLREGSYTTEYNVVSHTRTLELNFNILKQDDRVFGISVFGKDITERKRIEKKLIDSQETLRTFTSRLLTIQEEERRRLARELHDDFTQRLAVLAMYISKLEVSVNAANTAFEPKLKYIRDQIIKLSTDILDVSRQLHPSIINDLGLGRAIQSECSKFTKRTGIVIHYESIDISSKIPQDTSIGLFRITQEAIRNIHKHAKVQKAQVCLAGTEDCITLTIQDQGAGFDPACVRKTHGLGLFSMEERVQLIGGVFSIDSAPGRGTQIKVVVPLKGIDSGQS
jgi:two-component system cell cycle sensor histidine kinase/response regulator CckA